MTTSRRIPWTRVLAVLTVLTLVLGLATWRGPEARAAGALGFSWPENGRVGYAVTGQRFGLDLTMTCDNGGAPCTDAALSVDLPTGSDPGSVVFTDWNGTVLGSGSPVLPLAAVNRFDSLTVTFDPPAEPGEYPVVTTLSNDVGSATLSTRLRVAPPGVVTKSASGDAARPGDPFRYTVDYSVNPARQTPAGPVYFIPFGPSFARVPSQFDPVRPGVVGDRGWAEQTGAVDHLPEGFDTATVTVPAGASLRVEYADGSRVEYYSDGSPIDVRSGGRARVLSVAGPYDQGGGTPGGSMFVDGVFDVPDAQRRVSNCAATLFQGVLESVAQPPAPADMPGASCVGTTVLQERPFLRTTDPQGNPIAGSTVTVVLTDETGTRSFDDVPVTVDGLALSAVLGGLLDRDRPATLTVTETRAPAGFRLDGTPLRYTYDPATGWTPPSGVIVNEPVMTTSTTTATDTATTTTIPSTAATVTTTVPTTTETTTATSVTVERSTTTPTVATFTTTTEVSSVPTTTEVTSSVVPATTTVVETSFTAVPTLSTTTERTSVAATTTTTPVVTTTSTPEVVTEHSPTVSVTHTTETVGASTTVTEEVPPTGVTLATTTSTAPRSTVTATTGTTAPTTTVTVPTVTETAPAVTETAAATSTAPTVTRTLPTITVTAPAVTQIASTVTQTSPTVTSTRTVTETAPTPRPSGTSPAPPAPGGGGSLPGGGLGSSAAFPALALLGLVALGAVGLVAGAVGLPGPVPFALPPLPWWPVVPGPVWWPWGPTDSR